MANYIDAEKGKKENLDKKFEQEWDSFEGLVRTPKELARYFWDKALSVNKD